MGVQELAAAIKKAVKNNMKDASTQRGYISGSQVLVGGSWYNYTTAVDVDILDGDLVWIILNDTKTKAVIVGK